MKFTPITGVLIVLVALLGGITFMASAQNQPDTSRANDTAAVEALIAGLSDAWNHGDAKAYSARFAKDGGFTNILGMVDYGREAFEQRHAEIFQTIYKGSTAKLSIRKLRFIRPDVAIVDGDAELTGYVKLPPGIQAGTDGVMRTKLQLVLVKEKGDWWITAYHNVAVTPLPPRPQ